MHKQYMPDNPPTNKKLVPISEAAKILGVSMDTIRRWDKNGTLKSKRTAGNTRHFSIDDLEKIKLSKKLSISEVAKQLKISQSTLRRLEDRGLIKPERNNNGERLYGSDTLEAFLHSDYFMRQKQVQEEILKPLEKEELAQAPKSKFEKPEEKPIEETKHKILAAGQEETRQEVSRLKLLRNVTLSSVFFVSLS